MTNYLSKSLLRKNFSLIKSPKKPNWIKVTAPSNRINYTKRALRSNRVTTVCEEAMCPNLSNCWAKSHATFMILGDVCTRSCSFCNISTGKPKTVDNSEPVRIAKSVRQLDLSHVVITSVDRDDLDDGGAKHFANTINEIKSRCTNTTIEVLTPDFRNKKNALNILSDCQIDVFNHNLETVKSLYKDIRPGADYSHSLNLLKSFKSLSPKVFTKSGIMVGLGEKFSEVQVLMDDLISHDVDIITIGQYLRPTKDHYPVVEYHNPEYFLKLYDEAIGKGFKLASSSPFTRSSFHAEEEFKRLKKVTLNA